MKLLITGFFLVVIIPHPLFAYPLFGSASTGIRRLEAARLAHEGLIKGRKRTPGQLLSFKQVDLRLRALREMNLPEPDPAFTSEVIALLGGESNHYAISVLDLSDPDLPRYAEHNGHSRRNPGSVGKIAAAIAVFQALADIYPLDLEKRQTILRRTVITADEFIIQDSHRVPLWNRQTRKLSWRPLKFGDRGSLWEYLDWMLAASSNAAASMVMKQAMLLLYFGKEYPVSINRSASFFSETPKKELRKIFFKALQQPLVRNGVNLKYFRQGSFFTATGKAKVPGTTSYAGSRELMKLLLRIEQGRIIDPFSSREIKRLIYVTGKRVRYAASPSLVESAVYFKSGSLYKCKPEPNFECHKFQGNVINMLNSVAIVESPATNPKNFYFTTLMSNVLRKNSSVAHQKLATRIHQLIETEYEP